MKNIKFNEINGAKYLTFPHLEKHTNIVHAFTTRQGGISEGCFSSWNFGFNSGDNRERVRENYKILGNILDIKIENMILSDQTHDNNILYVTEKDRGKGIIKPRDFENIDGLITDKVSVAIITAHADCGSLFFYDYKKKIIGLTHSGWRGTVKKIAKEMIDKFVNQFGSDPENILVGIGPSIGKCCFEVDDDVYDIFITHDKRYTKYIEKKGIKYHIDLWAINRLILNDNGIPDKNIISANMCTKCNNDIFFSHRGQKGKRGIMVSTMMLK